MTLPADPLFPCRAKILRAQKELEGLSAEVDRFEAGFREGEAYSVSRHIDPNTGEEVHRMHVLSPIPRTDWGISVGIVVHLCRSALDNLIELLTEKHSRCAFFDTEFPVFDNAEDFGRRTSGNQPAPRSGLYKIRGVHPAAAQRIEDLQPYNASKRLADSILWTLHRLDNIDKHRAPAVVGLVGAVMGMQFRPRPTREVREVRTAIGHLPFDEGTEFARFDPPLGGEPSMHVDAKFSLDITFDGGPVDRREVVPTLRDVLDETAAILIEFAPFLA